MVFSVQFSIPLVKKNCIDNIFFDFSPPDFSSEVWSCEFSDHRVFFGICDVRRSPCKGSSRLLTKRGFNSLHSILEQLNWDIDDRNIGANVAFNTFHDNFVDAYKLAFLIKEPRSVCHDVRSRGSHLHWFTDQLREMRNHLRFLSELYERYRTGELRSRRNSLKLRYRLELKRAKLI
ncbi:hypothetical protein HHI36_020003 [Cryptolaemus montrouzieri]|uniref:Uncharacterized protein n=1 Tax=Cryptolaemus montrouzieri TaxID=559131 RepID=A0ABD2N9M9_9CUCU